MKILMVCLVILPLALAGGKDFDQMFQKLVSEVKDGQMDQDWHDAGAKPEWDGQHDINWTGDQKQGDGGFMESLKNFFNGDSDREEQRKEHVDEMKKNLYNFHRFLEKVKSKEEQEKKQKLALYKQMQEIKQTKEMVNALKAIDEDLTNKKVQLKLGVFGNLLEFCDCGEDANVLKRLKQGKFGQSQDDDDDDDDYGMGNGMGGNNNRTGSGSGMGGGMDDDRDGQMNENWSIAETAQYLRGLDKKERAAVIVSNGYKTMCNAAKNFLKHLAQVEVRFRQLRQRDN